MLMEIELATAAAQFGVAGLIGMMWLTERRAASQRERELTQVVEQLRTERVALGALIETVRANTAALVAMEAAERELAEAIRRLDVARRAVD
ncbi:MAG: hypothetical protein AAF747_00660 [Planctomycetota bacterium]